MKKYIRYIGLFILLFILSRIDFSQLLDTLFRVNIYYLLLAVVLNIPQLFFKSYRWNFLLKQQRITYSPVQSFLVYMSSLYIGFITPGRLGEFVKTLYLKSDKGINISKGFSSVLMDRLFDLYLLIILGFTGLWQFGVLDQLSDVFLVLTIIIVLTPLIMLNKHFMGKPIKLLFNLAVVKKVKGKVEENFEVFFSGLNQLLNPRLVFSGLLTCLGYLMFFIQCYLIVMAIGLSINFITITLFMAISNLISFIPISISGLGTRDATLIFLFSLIGLKPELAVSYAFLVFITFFVCGGLMGAVVWWLRPLELDLRSKSF